jgi:cell division protein FtsW (lipid II flippase)
MSARTRELGILILVGLITVTGFASVYIARQNEISSGSLSYVGFFFALYLVAHLVARLTVPDADPYLMPMAAFLTGIGLTEIYRLNPTDALRQGLWVVIGVACFALTLIALRHDFRRLESYKYLFGLSALALLFMPVLPKIGRTINGARLWVHVGSLQFQPGELGKIAMIVFLAAYLHSKQEVLALGRLKDFGPLLAIWGCAMLVLVATRDLGSALLFFGIFLAILYLATSRLLYVGVGLTLFLIGAAGVYQTTTHVRGRVTIWLNPWTTQAIPCPTKGGILMQRQECESFQLVKSLYSIAQGGFSGTGLGKGTFSLPNGNTLIPDLNTDFIFSALAQELGLVGIAALLLVLMLFVVRGFRIALQVDDGFSKLMAAGLTFGFALQTFIIIGGILRLIPLTGITLPFISYGGSSVVANFILLAGLMLVSQRANEAR